MSRWFRHYAGMARDDKLVRAALRSKQTIERVVWVWSCILESAAEIDAEGAYEIDHAEMAYFLRADEGDIAVIEDALATLGRVNVGAVVHWKDRQFQSDRSAERQKRYRERHKGNGDGDPEQVPPVTVTSPSRHRDAPETETETETETEAEADKSTSLRSVARARTAKGCRLPGDFVPDAAFAAESGLSSSEAQAEADKFRDYWLAKAGASGVKLDWQATWRNWVRRAAENRQHQARGSPAPKPMTPSQFADQLARSLEHDDAESADYFRLAGPVPGTERWGT